MTGPKSMVAQRFASRKLTQDHQRLWDTLKSEHGYELSPVVRKHRNSPRFVLQAVRGKGKHRKKYSSCKLKLLFNSKTEARKIESSMAFGDSLLSVLSVNRKRYRGTVECERNHDWDDNVNKKKTNSNSKKGELCTTSL